MGVVASANGSDRKNFEPATEMIQQAVLADIVDKGMVDNKFKPGSKQHKCYFVWILEEQDTEGRNKRVFESLTVSLHEKATLRKRVKEFGAVFTKGPDGKELIDGSADLDLDKYIGTKRTLVLSSEDGTDGTYIKVLATQKPSGKGVDVPADFVRKQDRKDA